MFSACVTLYLQTTYYRNVAGWCLSGIFCHGIFYCSSAGRQCRAEGCAGVIKGKGRSVFRKAPASFSRTGLSFPSPWDSMGFPETGRESVSRVKWTVLRTALDTLSWIGSAFPPGAGRTRRGAAAGERGCRGTGAAVHRDRKMPRFLPRGITALFLFRLSAAAVIFLAETEC